MPFSGNYNDLTNKPTIPTAFSGDYDDLTNRPTIPTIPVWRALSCPSSVCTITASDQTFMVEISRNVGGNPVYANVVVNRAQLTATARPYIHHTQNPDTATTQAGASVLINSRGQLVVAKIGGRWSVNAVYAK